MKKPLLILSLFLIASLTMGQKLFKFGKVSDEEMALEACEFYPDAKSMKLGEMGELRFKFDDDNKKFQYMLSHTTRIKVFDITEAKQGDIKISIYDPINSSAEERISGFKANTYNIEDGKIVRTKVDKKDFFRNRINDYWVELSVAIPNIKAGTIFEYTYDKVSDFTYNLSDWIFQADIPVQRSIFTYTIPEYYNYQTSFLGNAYNAGMEENEIQETFDYTTRGDIADGSTRSIKTQKGSFTSYSKKTTVEMSQIPPIDEEPYMTNKSDIPGRLEFQLVSTKYPNEPVKYVAGSYEKLNKGLMERSDFGGKIKKGNFLKKLDETVGAMEPVQAAAFLYKYVQKNIRWNGYTGFLSRDAGKQALAEGEGSVDDINLTLVALLKNYGLDANPVILSTRGHGTIHPAYPSYEDFNYVIAAVAFEDGLMLMDASSSLPMGVLPLKCRNGNGWMVKEAGGRMVNLKSSSEAKVTSTFKCDLTEDMLQVQGTKVLGGYAAIDDARGDSLEMINNFKDGLETESFELSGLKITSYEHGQSTTYAYNLSGEAADEIYFQPVLNGSITENDFKRESRLSNVDFPYKQSYKVMTQIKYPEAYTVELPESTRFSLPDKKGSFSYTVSQGNGMITVISSLKINETVFGVSDYPILRQFYQLVADKNQELIVFTK